MTRSCERSFERGFLGLERLEPILQRAQLRDMRLVAPAVLARDLRETAVRLLDLSLERT